jgi:hypothetical protein
MIFFLMLIYTNISSLYVSTLTMSLTSPSGTKVDFFYNSPFSFFQNIFTGTLWDDSSSVNHDSFFNNGVTATNIKPKDNFSRFRGQNPNGDWILTISSFGEFFNFIFLIFIFKFFFLFF